MQEGQLAVPRMVADPDNRSFFGKCTEIAIGQSSYQPSGAYKMSDPAPHWLDTILAGHTCSSVPSDSGEHKCDIRGTGVLTLCE